MVVEFKSFVVSIHYTEAVDEKHVNANPMTIGRSYSVDLPLIFTDVSRNHLKVYFQNHEIFIEDLGSKNGTFVNDQKIEPHKLTPYKPGDRLRLGKTEETLSLRAEMKETKKTTPLVKSQVFSSEPPPLPAEPPKRPDFAKIARPAAVNSPRAAMGKEMQNLGEEKKRLERDVAQLKLHSEKLAADGQVLNAELAGKREELAKLQAEIREVETIWKTKNRSTP